MTNVIKVSQHYRCRACRYMISEREMLCVVSQDFPCPRCGKQKLIEFQKVAVKEAPDGKEK